MRPARHGPVLSGTPGRWLTGAVVVAGVVSLSACGSTSRTAAAGTGSAGTGSPTGSSPTGSSPTGSSGSTPSTLTAATGSLRASAPAMHATVAGSSPATVSMSPTVSTAVADPASCRPGAVDASFDVQPDGGASKLARMQALIVVTDRSISSCTLAGFPAVDVVEGGRRRALVVRDVDQPARPLAVVLESTQSAFAGMEWTAAAGCVVVSSYQLVLPGDGGVIPVGLDAPGTSPSLDEVCTGDIELRPFAATSAGSLTFPDSVTARS